MLFFVTFLYASFRFYVLPGNIELLKYILSKGVDVDSQSDSGTPLVWAAGHGQQDALKVLLEHRANVTFYVFFSSTDMVFALVFEYLSISTMLIIVTYCFTA